MHPHNEESYGWPENSEEELRSMFTKTSPAAIKHALLKLYLCYASSDDSSLPESVEKVDKPLQVLLRTIGKLADDQ